MPTVEMDREFLAVLKEDDPWVGIQVIDVDQLDSTCSVPSVLGENNIRIGVELECMHKYLAE